ncbi:hypothetical protein PR048_027502 [Dryococelus australis]|uniref:Uncharacterized protein n=1 Tax=Dryococelus australis TaxID=614101 RepID=A0ABQ9GGP9_9NEOP|nr:hypothetical protein PR048_027502 [Dryococelus australis]
MEQHWNERAGKTGDPRENPSIRSIVQYDFHLRKSGLGIEHFTRQAKSDLGSRDEVRSVG